MEHSTFNKQLSYLSAELLAVNLWPEILREKENQFPFSPNETTLGPTYSIPYICIYIYIFIISLIFLKLLINLFVHYFVCFYKYQEILGLDLAFIYDSAV